jgi:hypothetical protein
LRTPLKIKSIATPARKDATKIETNFLFMML